MRISMLDRVEDANEFPDNGDPLIGPQSFTIGHRVRKGVVCRVDKIGPADGVVDLPTSQAKNLLAMGLAAESP